MLTGSLRTVAACCGLALAAASLSACRSRPGPGREVDLRNGLRDSFGFTGRMVAVDMGETGPIELIAPSSRLDGDLLLLLDSENGVHAIDRRELLAAWIYRGFPGALRYPPTTTAISLLAMSRNELHEIDLRHGSTIGVPIPYDMAPSAPFAATVGTAYIPAWGGSRGEKTLRTLNLVTGLEGWGYRTPGDVRGAVVVGGMPPRQTVYFATDAGDVYALPAVEADARAPEPSWQQTTRGAVTSGLCLHGDDLFVSSQSGFLYCMDRITGTVRWAAPHETPLTESPVATATSVYQFREGSLWCHDRATGAVRWKRNDAARFVVEREGKSLVATHDGMLVAVDAKGGTTGLLEAGEYYFPTNVQDPSIYAVSDDGFLFKLEVGGE
jgi:hypothetical protein